ncbi:MAG TPA: cytidylate kinase-like family protein [Pirellulales bacterium]|nr:cytidylate kinase-like family protein [Pirellulales bacterium]
MSVKTSAELTTLALERTLKAEAFERARNDWRRPAALSKSVTPAYTITISRESGAGGAAVARELGRLLEWPVYDRELLEHIAKQAGLRSELLESLDEKRTHWLTEILESFGRTSPMSGASYARHLAETILALASHGHCVIVGRGSTAIVPPRSSLRVRLVAPLDDRTERICKRLGVSKVAASEHVRFNDAHREGFVNDYFHHNVGDPHDYDLIINTSRFSVEESARLIIDALRQIEMSSQERLS